MTPLSREDVERLILQAGIALSANDIGNIHGGWMLMQPMLERNRDHDQCAPLQHAPLFRADAWTPAICDTPAS